MFFLGLFFGPLGLIASLGIDNRYKCVYCRGRVNDRPQICPHCHSELFWIDDPNYFICRASGREEFERHERQRRELEGKR